jgi:hypothetical protein
MRSILSMAYGFRAEGCHRYQRKHHASSQPSEITTIFRHVSVTSSDICVVQQGGEKSGLPA